MVKMTAIDACRACKDVGEQTSEMKLSKHPYFQRGQDLKIIYSRHKVEHWSYEKFLIMLFNLADSAADVKVVDKLTVDKMNWTLKVDRINNQIYTPIYTSCVIGSIAWRYFMG